MKYLPVLLLITAALLQGAFVKINLVLFLVIFLAAYQPAKISLWLAFFAGLILDLALGMPVGLSSFLLLVISYLLLVYSRRFDSRHPLFLAIFSFLAAGIYNYLLFKNFAVSRALVLVILVILTRLILRLLTFEPVEGIKLKL